MGTYLGFGQQGYGVGGYGGLVDDGSGGVATGTTTLFDADAPFFLVTVLMRVAGYKPTPAMTLVGPLVPFIRNFWVMNEATGTVANDIAGGNTGTIPTGWVWSGTGFVGESLHRTSGTLDITLAHAIPLVGPYTLETLSAHTGTWTHTVIVNDPVLGKLTYTNGVLTTTAAYDSTTKNITSLLALAPAGADQLEFVRIWTRGLTSGEVTALYGDVYSMFGATQANLDELSTVINFFKPAKSSWRFVLTYPTGETP